MLLRNPVEADDATQATFVSAFGALLRGADVRDPPAWLATIARNECRGRAHARMREPGLLEADLARSPGPHEEVTRLMAVAEIREAISELPEKQREAVVLRDLYGLRYEEVGAALGVSRASVESLLFRARRRLRVSLKPLVGGALVVPIAVRGHCPGVARLCVVGRGGQSRRRSRRGNGRGRLLAKLAAAPIAAKVAAAAVAVGTAGSARVVGVERAARDARVVPAVQPVAAERAPAAVSTGSRVGSGAADDDGVGTSQPDDPAREDAEHEERDDGGGASGPSRGFERGGDGPSGDDEQGQTGAPGEPRREDLDDERGQKGAAGERPGEDSGSSADSGSGSGSSGPSDGEGGDAEDVRPDEPEEPDESADDLQPDEPEDAPA